MIISLIQTARDREQELLRFINSLINQGDEMLSQVQYIFVDQGNNRHLYAKIEQKVAQFIYVQIPPSSLSYARNIGLKYATGEIVSFPDDDCWYPESLLSYVFNELQNISIKGITGRVTNENGICYNMYPQSPQMLSPVNLCGASSIGMFLKRSDTLMFDENIGVGTSKGIGSGEESDYLIRYIKEGNAVVYNPELVVYHPINLLKRDKDYLKKSFSYAIGASYIAKKNKLGARYYLKLIVRPLAGVFVFAMKGDFYLSKRSWYIFKGRLKGLLTPIIE